MAKKIQGYQIWPGQKKKPFYQGPKDKDGKTETQKWAEKKKLEKENKKISEDIDATPVGNENKAHETRLKIMKKWLKKGLHPEHAYLKAVNAIKSGHLDEDIEINEISKKYTSRKEKRENLKESHYDDEVERIAKKVKSENPKNKEEAEESTHYHGKSSVHYRVSDNSRKGFVKDILNKVKTPRDTTSIKERNAAKKAEHDKMLQHIAHKFEEHAGNAFPDGDPHDHTIPWIQRHYPEKHLYPEDAHETLQKAVKKHLDAKDSNDYLAKMWDSVKADHDYDKKSVEEWNKKNPDKKRYHHDLFQGQDTNPWKPISKKLKEDLFQQDRKKWKHHYDSDNKKHDEDKIEKKITSMSESVRQSVNKLTLPANLPFQTNYVNMGDYLYETKIKENVEIVNEEDEDNVVKPTNWRFDKGILKKFIHGRWYRFDKRKKNKISEELIDESKKNRTSIVSKEMDKIKNDPSKKERYEKMNKFLKSNLGVRKNIKEEAPTNSTGPAIAGITGEPPVRKKIKNIIKRPKIND